MSRDGLLLFFIFSLAVLVISINGQCGSSPSWDKEMESSEDSQDRMGRIGVECEPQGYGGGSGNTVSVVDTIVGFFILFTIFGVPIGICLFCIQRQRALNAANLNNISGQVAGVQMAHGTDLKSYPETNTVQKGDPNYQV